MLACVRRLWGWIGKNERVIVAIVAVFALVGSAIGGLWAWRRGEQGPAKSQTIEDGSQGIQIAADGPVQIGNVTIRKGVDSDKHTEIVLRLPEQRARSRQLGGLESAGSYP